MREDDEVITTPVGDGLVIVRRRGHHMFVLNEAARFMWERRAEGMADGDIPALMAARYGIDPAQAAGDFGAAMDEWRAKGLAEDDGPWRYFSIAGRVFRVHCDDPAHEAALAPILSHLALPADGGPADRSPEAFADMAGRAERTQVCEGQVDQADIEKVQRQLVDKARCVAGLVAGTIEIGFA